ncbi:prostasin-like [Anopheles merus]|uniref:prostasin-like n=1 Tax=Anopheles merus TaxID=30066 RepID=UPI001BE47FD3|nr:prostasin-like [Anopheles merus]
MLECRFVLPLALLLTISLLSAEAIQHCGVRKVKRVNLILGGRNATAGKWPWHATLMHRTGDAKKLACGGNIIDKHTILTAAHCLYDRHKLIALDRLVVILGRTELSVEEPWSRSYAPERLILHPGYKQANVKDDIAMVKLASEITMSDYIFPVCLRPWGLGHEDITGRKGFVVGYGLNDAGSTSNHLLDAEVPVVDRWTCLESNRGTLSSQLASTMLCAGARDGEGPCNGDSGGGMFFRAGNKWHIRGIVSFAPNLDGTDKCDPKQYAIYTDVAKYLDWIANDLDNVTQGNTSASMANSTDFRESQTWLTVNRDGCGLEAPVYTNLRHSARAFVAPWVAKIEYVGEERTGRDNECQAYLITEWHLLTLASCVADVDQNEQELYVRLGKFSIPGLPKPQIRYVEQIIIHERFDKSNNANDVALLKLRKKANEDEGFVNSICLAPAMFEGDDWITYELEGKHKNTTRSAYSILTRFDTEACREEYAQQERYLPSDDSFVCFGQLYQYHHLPLTHITVPGRVTIYWREKIYLLGLVSSFLPIPSTVGDPETSFQYLTVTNVSFYRSWIEDRILF